MDPANSLIKGPYAIVDNTYCPQTDHVALAHLFLKGGARLLQLRMKGERDLKKITRTVSAIMEFKKAYDFTFIVNDHAAVAREIGADGEHGGADDLPIQEERVLLGKGFLMQKGGGRIMWPLGPFFRHGQSLWATPFRAWRSCESW